jgi:hypothetical protein
MEKVINNVNNFLLFQKLLAPDILDRRQNLYALRSWKCTGRREAQSPEPVNKVKNFPVHALWYTML